MFIFNIIFSIIHLLLFLSIIYFIPDTIIIENTSGLMNRARNFGKPEFLARFYYLRTNCAWSNKSWFTKIYCSIAKNIVRMKLSLRQGCKSSKQLWLTKLSCSIEKKISDVNQFLILHLFFTNRAKNFGKPEFLA